MFLTNHLRFFIISIFVFQVFSLKSQMEVTPGNVVPFTPVNLIENVFLDEGVEVLNVTYNGDPLSVGYFENASGEIGIDRGVVMTTGFADDVNGAPNCEDNNSCSNLGDGTTGNSSGGSDPDLVDIVGGTVINDAAIYEITFIPLADTLEFDYVFASDEYPEFVCQFNDAFGFFISGPGITGPFSNNSANIALVPGTTYPVTIDNVNDDPNCVPDPGNMSFYNSNPVGSNINLEFDGFTKVFTARAVVIPCETYTIKLAVGDALDSQWDTGVFLAAKSFGTGSIQVKPTTVSIDGTISEGCTSATIAFVLPNPTPVDYPLNYVLEGVAENGVDYTEFPLDLVIPAGSDSVAVTIEGIEDFIDEGLESIELIVQTDVCFFDTIKLGIIENQMPESVTVNDTICEGQSIDLDASTLDPNTTIFTPPPIVFDNNDAVVIVPETPYEFTIDVSGVPYETVEPGVIQSICVDMTGALFISDIDLYLTTPTGEILILSTGNGGIGPHYTNTCFTEFAPVAISDAPETDAPYTGNYLPEAPWTDIYGASVEGQWSLIVYDNQTGFAPTFNSWSISFNNLYTISYEWTPPTGLSCFNCPDPTASPVVSTDYEVLIYDTYGCSVTSYVNIEVINQLPEPVLTCGASTANSVTVEWADVPGAENYEINVDNGGWVTVNPGDLFYEVTGLTVGQSVNFQVQAISADCSDSPIATINCISQECQLTTNVDQTTDITCFNDDDGSATISANGAGTITFDIGSASNNDGMFTSLAPGDYTVTITDSDCSLTETFTINEPLELTSTSSINDVSCSGVNDGSITVTPSGGTGIYSYQWSNLPDTDETINALPGDTYTVTITDENSCTLVVTETIQENTSITLSTSTTEASCDGLTDGTATVVASNGAGGYLYEWGANAGSQMTDVATNLGTGTYTVTVTDSAGCSETATATVTAPTSMSTTMSATEASCNGATDGTATVVASGGAGGYMYNWSDNAQNTPTAINLMDGWHYVTVTDMNGCMVIDSIEVLVPNPIVATLTGINVSCFNGSDGSATVTASGGSGNLTYAWNIMGEITSSITNITAGTYTVTVTDGNGCTVEDMIDITEPDEILLTIGGTNVACFGESTGTANVSVTGGTPVYSYTWSVPGNNDNISNLPIGIYTVTVSDMNSCIATDSYEVVEESEITSTTSTTDASCGGGMDGSATVVPSGGIGGFTYQWDNNTGNQMTATASNLPAGTYEVTITDTNGCSATNSATIIAPGNITTVMSSTPASCVGVNDGTATVTASGGAGGFTYNWSDNSQVTPTAINLPDGWHYVSVTDMNGCVNVDSVEVSVPNPMVTFMTANDASCFSGTDGSVIVAASGGAGNFSYAWNVMGEINSSITNVGAGTYTVTVTDDNGCTTEDMIDVAEPNELILTMGGTDVACFGGSTGSVNVSVTGGTASYSYSWSVPGNMDLISNLMVGTYTVTVTDANSCTASNSFEIFEETEITSSTSSTDASCGGGTDGSAAVSASGGTGSYTYQWDANAGNQITASASNLAAGSYDVTITDTNGCSITDSATVIAPGGMSTTMSSTQASCVGSTDGTATVVASGGTPSYTYLWSDNNQNTPTAINLIDGWHFVTVTDMNGCFVVDSVEVTVPNPILLNVTGNDATCFGASDGNAIASVIGGTGTISYAWNVMGENNDLISNLSAGVYTVTVTDDNGCTAQDTIAIAEPTEVTLIMGGTNIACFGGSTGSANVTPSGGTPTYTYTWSVPGNSDNIIDLPIGTYTVTVADANSCTAVDSYEVTEETEITSVTSTTSVSCAGGNDGTATITAQGGVGGYLYQWSVNANSQNTSTAIDLPAGIYTVTVTDLNGCTHINSTMVSEPSQITTTISSTPTLCNASSDGTATIVAADGSGGYTYNWSFGSQVGATATNLPGGWHYVTVTDMNNCMVVDSAEVLIPDTLVLNISPSDITCAGGSDGAATSTVSGGVGNYSYQWSVTGETNSDISNLSSGTYTLTVTDDNGCTISDEITINEPSGLVLTMGGTNVDCFGESTGSVNVSVTGGTGTLIYQWSVPGANDNVADLPAGTYTVTVEDVNGCTASDLYTITEQPELTTTISGTNASCFNISDGTVTITANGGDGTYFYAWNDPGGSNTATVSDLSAQIYTVTVTDGLGCSTTNFIEIVEPTELTLDLSGTDISCYGGTDGTVSAIANGGTAPITYVWNAGAGQILSNLALGTYTVTATDANACSITGSISIDEPDSLSIFNVIGDVSCNGGNDGYAGVTFSGGVAPYSITWGHGPQFVSNSSIYALWELDNNTGCLEYDAGSQTGFGLDEICLSAEDGNNTLSTYVVVSIISSGSCTPDPTDNDGDGICAAQDPNDNDPCIPYSPDVNDNGVCDFNETIPNTEVIPLVVETNNIEQHCINLPAGFDPNTTEFSYCFNTDSNLINNLSAGTYNVVITDDNNCTISSSLIVNEPAALNINLNPTDVSCFGGSDGEIDATITGGTGTYTYSWSNSPVTEDLTGIAAGTYTLEVTDENGCTASSSTTVNEPNSELTLTMSPDPTICFGANNGQATVSAFGGTPGYSYIWTDNTQTPFVTGLGPGSHFVTVTDTNGCTAISEVVVNELAEINSILSSTDASCFGGFDGTATVESVSGGVGTDISDFTFNWSTPFPQTNPTAIGLTAGQTYTVTITDSFGCIGMDTITIGQPTELEIALDTIIPVSCYNGGDGTISITGVGGTAPYTYDWQNGQDSMVAIDLSIGNYNVTVTDSLGCFATASFMVENQLLLTADVMGSNVVCYGETSGMAWVNAEGGVSPYSYIWTDVVNMDTLSFTDSLPNIPIGEYQVEVTDFNGCVTTNNIIIEQPDSLIFSTTTEGVTCHGDRDGTIFIEADGGIYPYTYSIDGIEYVGAANFPGVYPGYYTVYVQDANGCISSLDSIHVEEPLAVEAIIYPDTSVVVIELTDSIQLELDYYNTQGEVTIEWSGLYGSDTLSCMDCPTPIASDYENNVYSVIVTDENGCSATDEIAIQIDRPRGIFVPSGFTPNGDLMNDVLMVHGIEGTKVTTFRVYDRWGEMVFRADGYEVNATNAALTWDGTFKGQKMNPAVFVWYVEVEYVDGRKETFTGNSTLIR